MNVQIDPFWNEVLKRLAATGEENARLGKLRNDLEAERNALRAQLDGLTRQPPRVQQVLEARTVDLDKLNELEQGIKAAQNSYKLLEAQLQNNQAKIAGLAKSNEQLQRERSELERRCKTLSDALCCAEVNLKDARSQADAMQQEISTSLKREDTEPGWACDGRENEPRYVQRIQELEREIVLLKASKQDLKEENGRLQQNLNTASQKLEKYRSNDQLLREKLGKVTEVTRRRTPSMASLSQVDTTSPRNSHASTESTTSSTASMPFAATSVSALHFSSGARSPPSTRRNLGQSSTGQTREQLAAIDLTQIEENVLEEGRTPTPRAGSSSTACDVIPPTRRMVLAGLPRVVVPAIATTMGDIMFSRDFMKNMLGGSIQPLIVRVGAGKESPLGMERDIRSYLCPGLDHNPWCPSIPGSHGYIFVGLGKEKDTFTKAEIHNVFVGVKKTSKDNRRFRYLGKYRASRVDPLSIEEWQSLDMRMRVTYSKTTKEKNKDTSAVESIMARYEGGNLRAPCVLLQCIGFDEDLYSALVRESANSQSGSSSSSSNKRTLDYEADDDTARKRKTIKKAS